MNSSDTNHVDFRNPEQNFALYRNAQEMNARWVGDRYAQAAVLVILLRVTYIHILLECV